MILYLNGRWVPSEQAVVPVTDRGFLYGDGLFETIRIVNGQPFRWAAHWARVQEGAAALHLNVPGNSTQARTLAAEIVRRNECPEGVLRINISRGTGPRGYSPHGCGEPTFCMSLHPLPPLNPGRPVEWRLKTVSLPHPARDALSGIKSASKLRQVMAKAEAEEAGADEAVLLTPGGMIAEGAASNLFWFEGDTLCTPPLDYGILPGITRGVMLELWHEQGFSVSEHSVEGAEGRRLSGVICTLSSVGMAEAVQFDGVDSRRSQHAARLYQAYVDRVRQECPYSKKAANS